MYLVRLGSAMFRSKHVLIVVLGEIFVWTLTRILATIVTMAMVLVIQLLAVVLIILKSMVVRTRRHWQLPDGVHVG